MTRDKIKIRSILMCEDLRQEVTGLHSLIGVFADKIITVRLPVQIPKVVFRIAFNAGEDFSVDCYFSVIAPSGKRVFTNPQPIKMDVKKDLLNICAFGWMRGQFDEPGLHEFRFRLNEEEDDAVGSIKIELVSAGQ